MSEDKFSFYAGVIAMILGVLLVGAVALRALYIISKKAGYEGFAERLEEMFLFLIFVLAAITCFSVAWWHSGDDGWGSEGVRNTVFLFAGIGALYGLWIRTQQLKVEKETQESERGAQEETHQREMRAQENEKNAQRRTRVLTRKAQETESLSRAVQQLGNDRVSIRCVGVHLLQRAVEESERDRETGKHKNTDIVKNIIMAFVCDVCRTGKVTTSGEGERADVEVALRVLGEIISDEEKQRMDFSNLDFQNLKLDLVNLSNSVFSGVIFDGANLQEANLEGAVFDKNTSLNDSDLSGAILRKADLSQMKIKGTKLMQANLEKANLSSMKTHKVDFRGAQFIETDCTRSDFSTSMFFSDFYHTFSSASPVAQMVLKIVQKQVDGMIYWADKEPKLPDDLTSPKEGSYKYEFDDDGNQRRQLIKSGEFLDDN